MSNKKKTNNRNSFATKIIALILAALMVISVATTLLYALADIL